MAKTSTTLHFHPKIDGKEGSPTKGQAKETKNTVVYDECNEDGTVKEFGVAIGQLYVTKEYLKTARPKLITMVLSF